MNPDGSACAKIADIGAHAADRQRLARARFRSRVRAAGRKRQLAIVFASTRGNVDTSAYDYTGAQRTPADPSKPNSNLYVYEPDPNDQTKMRVRQLTYLLDMERAPSFMQDGRVIFTAEKREPGFYQLALRRINLDGGDYHPLYGQRGSIGFHEVPQVVQLSDKNFAAVFADPGTPHHGGSLGIFNRCIGIDFGSDQTRDYPIDPTVINPRRRRRPSRRSSFTRCAFPDASRGGRSTRLRRRSPATGSS